MEEHTVPRLILEPGCKKSDSAGHCADMLAYKEVCHAYTPFPGMDPHLEGPNLWRGAHVDDTQALHHSPDMKVQLGPMPPAQESLRD